MASTYTTGFGIEKIGDGEQAGAWGTTTNHNLDIVDRIASYKAVGLSGTTHTLTIREASPGSGTENLQDGMYRVIKFTGALGANNTVTIAPNTSPAWFIIENATTDSGSSGPYSVILTQGSGANITVLNGKNAAVYCDGAGSGAAIYDAFADLQVATVDASGDITGSTLNADGDTAAGDNAAIGYTSAEGLILTGQGSTNDVTIKNDADADVITIATGGTAVDVVGALTAATVTSDAGVAGTTGIFSSDVTGLTLNATGDTAASDNAAIGYTSAEGLILTGQGSTNDVTIKNDADADVLKIPTGTTNVGIVGVLNIDNGGSVVVGRSASPISMGGSAATLQSVGTAQVDSTVAAARWSADADGPRLIGFKSRNASIGSTTIVQDDDALLDIVAYGDDAAADYFEAPAAMIRMSVDGTPGTNDMPGRITFHTSADGGQALNERMRIDSSGKVGIGTASPGALFHSYTTDNDGTLKHEATGGNAEIVIAGNRTSNADIGHLRFYNNGGSANLAGLRAERNASNTTGILKAQVTLNGSVADMITLNPVNSQIGCKILHPGDSTPDVLYLQMLNAAPDDNTQYFLTCGDSSSVRCIIYSDGDIVNADNSYGAISDFRIKTNIRDANSQWDDIKAIRVRNFIKKEDKRQYGDKAWEQLGLIAQELEEVSPKLIAHHEPGVGDILSDSAFGSLYTADDPETQDAILYEPSDPETQATPWVEGDNLPDGVEIGDIKIAASKQVGDIKQPATAEIGAIKEIKDQVKSINYSILYMKAVKALQEAMARIETLEAKVAALEA